MRFKIFLETLVLYRGAPSKEEKLQARGFPGVYLTVRPQSAKSYGKEVSSWVLPDNVKLFDIDDPRAKNIAHHFMKKYGWEYDQEQEEKRKNIGYSNNIFTGFLVGDKSTSGENPEDDLAQLALYPNQRWVNYLNGLGYVGMKNTEDYFIFDPSILQPNQSL